MKPLPISAVIPTRDRPEVLSRTLSSLRAQGVFLAEIIVVDASSDDATRRVVNRHQELYAPGSTVVWQMAAKQGAAVQRNQGVEIATQKFICLFDDDILFEPNCVEHLWNAIESDRQLGGVNAMIINQSYQSPGFVSRTMFILMHGRSEKSFAGKVIGPGINLLPEDRGDLPEVVSVEWLNLGCTIYRREALPSPPFDTVFKGYSLMEDLALSLRVAKKWRLANVRTARVFHDSQAGEHKRDTGKLAEMELLNRHYVMTKVLSRNQAIDYLKLLGWELFQLTVCAMRGDTRKLFLPTLLGKFRAAKKLMH